MDPRTIFNYNFLQDPFGILTNLDNEKKDLSEVDEALSKLILLYFSEGPSKTWYKTFINTLSRNQMYQVFSFLLFALSKFPTNLIFPVFVKNFQQDF